MIVFIRIYQLNSKKVIEYTWYYFYVFLSFFYRILQFFVYAEKQITTTNNRLV